MGRHRPIGLVHTYTQQSITQCSYDDIVYVLLGYYTMGRGLQIHRLLIRCNEYISREMEYPPSHCGGAGSVTNQFNIIFIYDI